MKKLLSIILILLTINASSQNFLPFHKDRPAYYNFNSYDIFYTQAGIFIDSFKVFGSDTVFYHYPIIDYDNSNGCYIKAHDTSFVGHHSIRTANGDDEFFNRYGDTIFFKNNSAVNDSWTMLNLGGGNKIVATVQSIALESVLGVSDSVKKIKLQAKDSLGNSISNIFNNKIFKIGKSFGLISGYSLFHFPFDTIAFSIVGIENPSVGLSSENLTPGKIFDFEVGDRFDYISGHNGNPNYYTHTHEIFNVLSKEIIGDTFIYQMRLRRYYEWTLYPDYSTSILDVNTYIQYELSKFSILQENPSETWYEFNAAPFITFRQGLYPISPVIISRDEFLNLQPVDCAEYFVADCTPEERYAYGLGKTYSYCGEPDPFDHDFDTLVYYQKNGIEWGDSINWEELTGFNSISKESSINIFPNPTHSQLFLSRNFSPSQTHFTLLNSLGEEMKLPQLSNQFGPVSFDVHSLPPGLYVLQVKKEDEVVNLKFIKE